MRWAWGEREAQVACEERSAKKSCLSAYHCSSRSGVQIWTRLPNWLVCITWSSSVFSRRNTIMYSDFNQQQINFTLKLPGEFSWKYGPIGLLFSVALCSFTKLPPWLSSSVWNCLRPISNSLPQKPRKSNEQKLNELVIDFEGQNKTEFTFF